MRVLNLRRFWMDNFRPTFGTLTYGGKNLCYIMEPPWKNNMQDVSCIEEGLYKCTYNGLRSGLHSWLLWEVKDRWGILMHSGSQLADTTGCLLYGTELLSGWETASLASDLHWLLNSTAAAKEIFKVVGKEPFMLNISTVKVEIVTPESKKPEQAKLEIHPIIEKAQALASEAEKKPTKIKKTIGWILIIGGYVLMLKEKTLGVAVVEIGKQLTK